VDVNDVRLSGSRYGSKIKSGESDVDDDAIAPPNFQGVFFIDDDGSGAFNPGDFAYLKMTQGDHVNGGDIRLTRFGDLDAGTVVSGSDPDAGITMELMPSSQVGSDWKYYNTGGGSTVFDSTDELWIDADTSDDITVRDIQVSPAPTGAPSGGEEPPPEDEPPAEEPPPSQDEEIAAQLDALLAQNRQLSQQLNASLSANANLQTQLAHISAQLSNQSAQVSSLNAQITTLQAENAKLQQQAAAGSGNQTGQKTPGPEPLLALLAIGAAVAVLRRR
jgi:hypothetical protein